MAASTTHLLEHTMDFGFSPRTQELQAKVQRFMEDHIYPNEQRYWDELAANSQAGKRWTPLALIEELKPKARAQGLWNLFLPESEYGAGLTNQEYAPLAEIMGRTPWASEVFNCSAPDTGNMETIVRYGTAEQKRQWLEPLLEGRIRSAFAMTEPEVASSDATNITARIERDGGDYVVDLRRRRPTLQDLHLHGQDRSGCAAVFAAVDDPGAGRRAGDHDPAPAVRLRLRRRAARPHGSPVRERARAGKQPPARRRPRLRDRAGPPRPRTHPPLHAPVRPGRARAGAWPSASRWRRRR
jgi:hypothetical protein